MAKRRGAPKKKAVEKQPSEEKEIVKSDDEIEEKSPEKVQQESDLEEVSEDEQPKKKTSSKSKKKGRPASKKPGKSTSPDDEEDEIESQSTSKKQKGRPKKSTTAKPKRGKGKSAEKNSVGESDQEDEDERKQLKRGRASTMNSESEPEEEVIEAKQTKRGRPSSKIAQSDSEEEVKKKPTKKGRPSSKASKSNSDEVDGEKKRGKSSSKTTQGQSESEEETLEYEVDRILDVQFLKNGKREFLIKWKGYSKEDSTWEPESHLDCQDLLDNFMSKLDDNNLSRPRRLSARPSTMMQTRISESRSDQVLNSVQKGRINKYERRSSVSSSRSFGQVQSINTLRNGQKLSTVLEHVPRNRRQRSYRGTIRAVLLSCGMVASLSAALLYSSSGSLDWDSLSLQAQEVINNLRDKVEVLYQSATTVTDSTFDL